MRYKNHGVKRETTVSNSRGWQIDFELDEVDFSKINVSPVLRLEHPVHGTASVSMDSIAFLKNAIIIENRILSALDFLKVGNKLIAVPVETDDYKTLTKTNERTSSYKIGDKLDDGTTYLGPVYTVSEKVDLTYPTSRTFGIVKVHAFLKNFGRLSLYKSKPMRNKTQTKNPITYWDELPDLTEGDPNHTLYFSKTKPKSVEIIEDYEYSSYPVINPGKYLHQRLLGNETKSYSIDGLTVKGLYYNNGMRKKGLGLKIDGNKYDLKGML